MSDEKTPDENILSRWSRLKRRAAEPAPPPEPGPAELSTAGENDPPPPPTLEDAAALTAESDFRPFLALNVPEDVHRIALRKLWMSDPIITTHDGLTDYAEDYTLKPHVEEVVRTVWNAGREALENIGDEQETKTAAAVRQERYDQENIPAKSGENIPDQS